MLTPHIRSISVIGSGNVATHLTQALSKCGFKILEINSRTFEKAEELANTVGATAVNQIEDLSPAAELYLFSISDDAYPDSLKRFPHQNAFIAHTAGSLSIDILKNTSDFYGVLYPFQTLSKEKEINFTEVPILYSGCNDNATNQLKSVAERLSKKTSFANDTQRKQLHISAVFACNFVNHLYGIAKKITDSNGIDFSLLHPLIQETATKAQRGEPSSMQTGPAIRGDESIVKNHLSMLKDHPSLQAIYKDLSQAINPNLNLDDASQL